MIKTLRKYNKHLLVVFMAGLLVVWLGSTALRDLLRPKWENPVIGRLYGEEIDQAKVQATYRHAELLTALIGRTVGFSWDRIWVFAAQDLGLPMFAAMIDREPLDPLEWYMLVQQANRAGIVVPSSEVHELKTKLPNAAAVINNARDRFGASLDEIDAALAEFLRVRELVRRAAGGIQITEPQIRQLVKQVGEKVRVKFVPLPARAFGDAVGELTEEELQAQFDQYKDVPPGTGGEFGFGYQQPAAVQFEYVKVDLDELVQQINIDEGRAFSYWQDHKDEFTRPAPETQPTTTAAAATQPTTTAAAQTQPVPYERFDEAKEAVLKKLKEEQARPEALALARDLINVLNRPWRGAETRANNYLEAPAEVKEDGYLMDQVDRFRKRRFGEALQYARSPWRDRKELWQEPGIGRAAVRDVRSPLLFSQLAFQVEGLVKERPTSPEARGGQYYLALYQPCPSVLTDSAGNAYVFRVIAVREPQPPETLDVVRAKVEQDLRMAKAYGLAGEAAAKLTASAKAEGLDAALQASEALKAELGDRVPRVSEPPAFAREALAPRTGMGTLTMTSSVPGIGSDPGFIRACFQLGAEDADDPAYRVRAVENPTQLRWVVVQWLANEPLREDVFRSLRRGVAARLYVNEASEFLKNFFDPDAIRRRVDWADAERPNKTPAKDEEGNSPKQGAGG
jgi:hypothetical protein